METQSIYNFIQSKSLEHFGYYNKGLTMEIRFMQSIDFDVYLPTKQKNLQRGFVWTLEQKRLFIISKLLGNYIAPITLIQSEKTDESKVFEVIDGKQRLSTIIDFFENKFSITINDKDVFCRDNEKFFKKLSGLGNITANVFYEYPDRVISDDTKIAMFEACSFLGTPQDLEHLTTLKI